MLETFTNAHEPIAQFLTGNLVAAYRVSGARIGEDSDEPPLLVGALPAKIKDFLYFKNTYLLKYERASDDANPR